MRTIKINAHEHTNAHEALVELNFSGDRAISLGGRVFTVTHGEFDRIEGQGVQPSTWHDRDGQLICVPGRNG